MLFNATSYTIEKMENDLTAPSQSLAGRTVDEKILINWRIQLVEFAFQLSNYLTSVRVSGLLSKHKKELTAVLDLCLKLSRIPDQDGKVIIRYRGRGIPGESRDSEKFDYVFRFGNIEIDIPLIKAVARRGGVAASHLPWRLIKSFEGFAALDINTLFLDIGSCHEDEIQRLRQSLEITGRYFNAVSQGGVEPLPGQVDPATPAIIYNEKSQPDPNLTLLTALNRTKPAAMQELVRNVEQRLLAAPPDSPLKNSTCVYDAIFYFKKLREQLIRPPIEINNVKWLMVSEDQEVVSTKDMPLAKEVLTRLIATPQKAGQVLASIYGDELLGYNAEEVEKWLEQVAELLKTLSEEGIGKDEHASKTAIDFIRKRLAHVTDDVLDNLVIDGQEVVVETMRGTTERIQLPNELLVLLDYFKKRSGTRKKMRDMLRENIVFDDNDLAIIAADFSISNEDAKVIIGLLRGCFDEGGRFLRKVFEKNIPEFIKHEKNIFQFLWHYMKEITNRLDRVSYLNTLQVLISEMKDPREALLVLLADLIKTPLQVTFFDRNAVILSTILLRKYNKELRNEIEITPEEVLLVRDGLDADRIDAAAELIFKQQEKFYQKVRLIHEKFEEAMTPRTIAATPMPIRYLVTLEREAYIFMSLIGGVAAHKIVRDAAEEYGNPQARIYLLERSLENVPSIMQLFKVIIRALDRFADPEDLSLLRDIRGQEKNFLQKMPDNQKDQVKRVMEWVDKSIVKFEKAMAADR